MHFELVQQHELSRRGRLVFDRGIVETPAFMPVGTSATVKALTPEEVASTGAQIILGNTFHLMLQPGTEVINAHGTLHDFMNWPGPILTDSGGFQVWSLAELRKLEEKGVTFRSPVDGSKVFLGPEESMDIQTALGSDIVMVFDDPQPRAKLRHPWHCPPDGRRDVKHITRAVAHFLALFKAECFRTCGCSQWSGWWKLDLMVMRLAGFQ